MAGLTAILSEDTQVEMEEELQGYLMVKLPGSSLPRSSNPQTLSPNQEEKGDLTSKTGHGQAQGHRSHCRDWTSTTASSIH